MLYGVGMGTTLNLIRGIVDSSIERYIKQYCVQIGESRDGYKIFGCESGIFARAGLDQMSFEYHLGFEWIQHSCKMQLGDWMFYSAKIPQVGKLLTEKGINISVE